MRINNDYELMVFDQGYKLGFRAGQLARRREMIEGKQRIEAEMAGVAIAIERNHISLEEFALYNAKG